MSTSLYWRIANPNPEGERLGYELKFYLAERYFGHDGSLQSNWVLFTKYDKDFLEGVKTATNSKDVQKEVDRLLDLIEKHEAIEVRLIG